MAARVCESRNSSVHCEMFPVKSRTPKELLPAGKRVTSDNERMLGPGSSKGSAAAFHSSPQGYMRPSRDWAAYCHSHSCGRRLPRHCAYARASSIDTQVTGLLSDPCG